MLELHGRVQLRAGLTRKGCGGQIFPQVTETEGTILGPTAALFETLHSIGWSWPRLQAFSTGSREYTFPMDDETTAVFQHELRQAFRERELRDTQHHERRHDLKPRKDLEGVQRQLRWDENVHLHRRLSPFDAAVLEVVMAGGIMCRERVSRHAKRFAISPKCVMPGCDCAIETTEHRLWHCPAHEHLRRESFNQLRARLHAMLPCEINCGLATDSFPAGFDVADMQYVMLQVELNARRILDEVKHGYEGDNSEEEQYYYVASTGVSGSHGAAAARKRPEGAPRPKAKPMARPAVPHPPAQLQFSGDGSRVKCFRCTHKANRSHSTNWRGFWEAECIDVAADSAANTLRGVQMTQIRHVRDRAAEQQTLQDLASDHQVPVSDMLWSGDAHAPVTCKQCEVWVLLAVHGGAS